MRIKKKTLKKILCFIPIIFGLINICIMFSGGNIVSAAEGFDMSAVPGVLGSLINGLVGIIALVPKLLIVISGYGFQLILNSIGSAASGQAFNVSIENIIFSGSTVTGYEGVELLSMDFFNYNTSSTAASFRTAIAKWYYIFRLISVSILLVMLIYVGIRMALSTIASEEAKYKQMLVDWVQSIALLFVLHYIIQIVISINNSLINVLAELAKKGATVNGESVGSVFHNALITSVFTNGIGGFFSAIMFFAIKGQAFMFFILYMKRMVTVGFLIIIAPLITITYSIDKIGDGKAQALNTWLKEFIYNVLIQPFHCIIYIAFFGAIAEILNNSGVFDISAYVLAFVVLNFMRKAEDILKKIFHFEASSSSSMSETGQNLMNATGKFAAIGAATGKGISNFRANGGIQGVKDNFNNFKQNRQANSALKTKYKNGTDSNNNKISDSYSSFRKYKKSEEGKKEFNDLKKTSAREMKEKVDAKRTDKARKRYDKKNGPGAYDKMVSDKANKLSEEDIEKRAEKDYDAKFGPGKYNEVKATANKKDKNGNPTGAAKKAQNILNKQSEKAKNKIANEAASKDVLSNSGMSGVKKKITGSKVFQGAKKFVDPKTITGAYLRDSAKVASYIAAGSLGYGFNGQLNDAYSAIQLAQGFSKGLENSNRTITNDTAENTKKYLDLTGKKPEEISKILESIKTKGDSKHYDNMNKITSDLVKELTKVMDSKSAKKLTNDIQAALNNDEKIDLNKIISESNLNLNSSDTKTVTNLTQNYSETVVEKKIYDKIQVAEATGQRIETISEKVEKKTEKIIEKEEKVIIKNKNQPQPQPTNNP